MSACLLAAWLASLTVPSAVGAQTGADREAARQHYEAGAAAFEAGDYASALVELQDSYDLFASLRTLFSIAQCQQALFDYPAALRALERYLGEGGDDVPADIRAEAQAMVDQMTRDMARLAVTVNVDGAQIAVDGVRRTASPASEPIEVGPGVHVVEVRRTGYATGVQRVSVAAGRVERVGFELEPVVAAPTAVRIEAAPVTVRVLFDGSRVGETPLTIPTTPGEHELRAEAEGYVAVVQRIVAVEGQTVAVALELVRTSAPLPVAAPPRPATAVLPESTELFTEPDVVALAADAPSEVEEEDSLWWVWVLVGSAVAAGGITAGVLLWPEESGAYDLRGRMP